MTKEIGSICGNDMNGGRKTIVIRRKDGPKDKNVLL